MKKRVFILPIAALLFAACSSDDNKPTPPPPPPVTEEAIINPNVGGPNEPNQVYIHLRSTDQREVKRDTWDLGFASGSDFRVIINGSIKMAVKKLETTNIDEVQQSDSSVSVGFTTDSTLGYVDDPTGVLNGNGNGNGTAIATISTTDADNKVYLVNLGFEVGTETPSSGVAMDGNARGWKKIRITRNGNDYVLQYADLNATTHSEVTISKDANYNFTFFSFNTNSVVEVQPQKDKWDLNFTGFTNYFPFQGGFITYYFADFITTNLHGGTRAYKVETTEEERDSQYEAFSVEQVEETEFTTSSSDQRIFGDSWRSGGGPGSGPSIKNNVFYIVKDTEGNLFKLKFLALTNEQGVRGYPVFEYKLLK